MPIRLDVTLLSGRYDAGGGDDPHAMEWPPHPARVFAALRAVAADDEVAPLRELEKLAPPIVHAAHASMRRTEGYVVTNAAVKRISGKEKRGEEDSEGSQFHVRRTNAYRLRVGAVPDNTRFQLDWRDGDMMTDAAVEALDDLARRVAYVGRSTSSAMLRFSRVTDTVPAPGLVTYEPTTGPGGVPLRVPFPGYLEELNALHEAAQPAWQAAAGGRARCMYAPAGAELVVPSPSPLDSPYPDLVVLRFVGQRPPGSLVGLYSDALRRKVMGQTRDPLPPALHGHGLPGQPHVAYLGLPFVGFPHADGQLMALAVAIPGLDRDERRRILRGILGDDTQKPVILSVPGLRRPAELQYRPDDPLPWSANEARWTRPSRVWVSATPLVLDEFPKKGDFLRAVRTSVVQAGLPEPVDIEISKEPLTTGAVRLQPDELPRRCRGRLYRHVRLIFDRSIRGPIIAGAGRYFGVGLFAPESVEDTE